MELLERTSQLQNLESALALSKAGQGCVALVYGEAGIGKTSLVDHFIEQNKKSWRILQGACDSLFTPRPLGPLHDIALQISSPQGAQGNLLQLLESESNRTAIFSACLNELKTQAAIMVIEDVHWADEATLDLLKYLGRRIRQTASLIVLTYRDDEIGVDHPLRMLLGDLSSSHALHHIRVPALSKDAVRELAKNKNVDADSLHHITNGNPFFITEVLASEGGIPETVRGAVWVRAARLTAAARSVLEAAAVIGSRAEPWLLSKVAGAESAGMDECIERGMLQPQGDYYTFRHELARQTILESIPAQRKIVLHRMTLSALKESPATRNDLARLAHHAEGTKDAAAVLEYALAAGKQASSVSSHREAAAQYARALRYAEILPQDERAQLFENRSYELWLSGQLEDAVNAQQSAYAAWQQLGRLDKAGNCLRFLAQVTMFAGNLDASKSYIAKALEIVDGFPPGPDLANVYSTKARIHMVFGEDNEALLWGTRAIELAEAQGAADALITALNTVGNVEQLYTPEIGQAKLKRSLALALEYQMYEHVARAYGNLGEGEYDQRRYDHALEYDAMAIEYAEKHDLDIFGFYTKRARAKVYFDQGRWPEAAAEADEVMHSNLVFPMTHADALIVINRVRVREGQPVSPEEIDWLVKYAAGSIVSERCHVAVLFAELAWLQGDLKRCRAEVESIFQTAHQFNFSRELGELAYWMWRAGALIEPPEDVAEPFVTQIAGNWQKAAAIWKQYGCPYEQGMALMDGDEAAQLAALEIFEQLGARPIMEKLKQQMRTQGIRLPRRARPATRKNLFNLTARELEVLGYLVKSLSNSAIAKQLSLSTRTVDHHIASVLQKMDVQSRSEAAALALKDGLISSE